MAVLSAKLLPAQLYHHMANQQQNSNEEKQGRRQDYQ
jgi:hypothetical protein